mmetsp:Transcript_25453/g.74987  ORF Transcript_25453/g.74987 Transcript_25453/m.74987 type:complete len:92 (+) Transcript_25453:151-426(+)
MRFLMLVVGYSALLLCLLLSHGTGFFAHFLLFSAASLSLDPIPSAGESAFLSCSVGWKNLEDHFTRADEDKHFYLEGLRCVCKDATAASKN